MMTRQENQTMSAVTDAHRTLTRYQSRTGGDWARDGYSVQAAQVAVEKAQADYDAAFRAYAEGVTA